MRIGRIETGLTKFPAKTKWQERLEFSYMKGFCGCHIFSLALFYFTWLGDECHFADPENEET